jgi:hypothetical protein
MSTNRTALLAPTFGWFLLTCSLAPQALAAPDQIGLAVAVRNNVTQVEPKVSKILAGDDVIRDEVVRTMAESGAKFVLKDSTNLILGPSSTLKLDRAVFSDEKTAGDIAIKLTVGSFRFITGNSTKESYAITTPIATMGVRGTTLDVLIELLKNTVVLQSDRSQAQVCAAGKCIDLLKVGDTAIVTAGGGRINIEFQPSSSWSFEANCSGMCGQTSFAEAQNSLTTGSLGGGGGGGGGPTNPIPTGGANGGLFSSPTGGAGTNANPPGNLLSLGGASGGSLFVPVSPR